LKEKIENMRRNGLNVERKGNIKRGKKGKRYAKKGEE
jgi:hypothetical protein